MAMHHPFCSKPGLTDDHYLVSCPVLWMYSLTCMRSVMLSTG
jgi:hypothetical protein